jgi:hypothetical protein
MEGAKRHIYHESLLSACISPSINTILPIFLNECPLLPYLNDPLTLLQDWEGCRPEEGRDDHFEPAVEGDFLRPSFEARRPSPQGLRAPSRKEDHDQV